MAMTTTIAMIQAIVIRGIFMASPSWTTAVSRSLGIIARVRQPSPPNTAACTRDPPERGSGLEDVSIMRLPRVRFTVRRLMVIVAVVAIAIGGVINIEKNRARRDWLSGMHNNLVNGLTKQAISFDMSETERSKLWAKIRWHEVMEKKYR